MFSILSKLVLFHSQQRSCVLATLYNTEGSTYRKPGARMVIDDSNTFYGLLSGGCFEGDIQFHAEQVSASGQCQLVEYDLLSDEDLTWGVGAGCKGVVRILLQPLSSTESYAPFLAAHTQLLEGQSVDLLTILILQNGKCLSAETRLREDCSEYGLPNLDRLDIDPLFQPFVQKGLAYHTNESQNEGYIAERQAPPTRLLILGAGLDALPLVQCALALDWLVTLVDHRKSNLDLFDKFPVDVVKSRANNFKVLQSIKAQALVIMSHHFESDAYYLKFASSYSAEYVGLLGPVERRNDLLAEHELTNELFRERLFSPAGLDLGAETPEEIALAIVAEIKQVLSARSGKSLRLKQRGIHD